MEEDYPYVFSTSQVFIDPEKGLEFQSGVVKKKSIKKGFVGNEAVSWFYASKLISMVSLTRKHCVEFCQLLYNIGMIQNALIPEDITYQDEPNVLYRITDKFETQDFNYFLTNYEQLKKYRNFVTNVDEMTSWYESFISEIEIKDRYKNLYSYKKCFIGSEAISWFCKKYNVTRQVALVIGENLRKSGAFDHVVSKYPFIDGPYFYRMRSLEEFTSKRPLNAMEFISKEFGIILTTPLVDLPVSKDLLRMYKQFIFSRQEKDGSMTNFPYTSDEMLKSKDSQMDIICDLLNFLQKFVGVKSESPRTVQKEKKKLNLNEDRLRVFSDNEQQKVDRFRNKTVSSPNYVNFAVKRDDGRVSSDFGPFTKDEFVAKVNSSDHMTLTKFLIFYGEESKLIKILKLCHQGIVVGFLGRLGERLFYNYGLRFKDIKGSWFIHVVIQNGNDREDGQPYISVAHERREQAIAIIDNSQIKNLFSFQWKLEIDFDSLEMNKIEAIQSKMLQIDWSSSQMNLNKEEEEKYEKKFVKLFNNMKHQGQEKSSLSPIPLSPIGSGDTSPTLSGYLSTITVNVQTRMEDEDPQLMENFIQIVHELLEARRTFPSANIDGLSKEVNNEIGWLLSIGDVKINKEESIHVKLLQSIYFNVTRFEIHDIHGEGWKRIGFTDDPLNELFGTGLFGLLIFVAFTSKFCRLTRKLFFLSKEKKVFPFSFIIMSFVAYLIKFVLTGALNGYLGSDSPLQLLDKFAVFLCALCKEFRHKWKSNNWTNYTQLLVHVEEKFGQKFKYMIDDVK